MIRFIAIAALAIGSWAVWQPGPSIEARSLDKLVSRMADPALGHATPDQLQAVLAGTIQFDPAPSSMNAPYCAVTLPIQPDQTISDGIAGFASDAADGSCPAPHLRHLALRVSTPEDFSPADMVETLRGKLGAPDEREEAVDGTMRVSWIGTERALFVEYDPKQPDTAALFLIKRPKVSAL